jgi:hypothetical protein
MTDEIIKEEYDVWISDVECTENERRFFSQYPAENHPTAIGFYAGFRTAERLAKIEALEEVSNYATSYGDYQTVGTIEAMLSELKEAKR